MEGFVGEWTDLQEGEVYVMSAAAQCGATVPLYQYTLSGPLHTGHCFVWRSSLPNFEF